MQARSPLAAPVIRWLRRVSSSRSPPSVSASVVHSQLRAPESSSPSAGSCQGTCLVPPSWFLATSTVFSDLAVQALLQPAADPGVHRVSCVALPAGFSWIVRVPQVGVGHSRDAFTPRRCSLPTAVPSLTASSPKGRCVTLGPCPLAVSRVIGFEALLRRQVFCSSPAVAGVRVALSSHGLLFPLRSPVFSDRWETHFSLPTDRVQAPHPWAGRANDAS